jgi:hypothetical protein
MQSVKRLVAVLAAAGLAAPALAVGMAPLVKQGMAVGPAKAFYLTVINPYPQARAYRAYADGDETAAQGITILPAEMTIKPGGQRKIMVILRDLAPGETREARVCAELAKQEGFIHARVCSKLTATRLAPRLAPRT